MTHSVRIHPWNPDTRQSGDGYHWDFDESTSALEVATDIIRALATLAEEVDFPNRSSVHIALLDLDAPATASATVARAGLPLAPFGPKR